MRAASLLLSLASLAAAGGDPTSCQACTHSVAELLKAVPVLSKTSGFREGDKELALGDALPSMCVSNVFKGLEEAAALEKACKPFAAFEGPAVTSLLAGGGVAGACEAACAGVPEEARAPAAAAPKKPAAKKEGGKGDKGGKADPRKGSVDDPAYKAALKAKAKRDEARAKRNKKGGDAEEL